MIIMYIKLLIERSIKKHFSCYFRNRFLYQLSDSGLNGQKEKIAIWETTLKILKVFYIPLKISLKDKYEFLLMGYKEKYSIGLWSIFHGHC